MLHLNVLLWQGRLNWALDRISPCGLRVRSLSLSACVRAKETMGQRSWERLLYGFIMPSIFSFMTFATQDQFPGSEVAEPERSASGKLWG